MRKITLEELLEAGCHFGHQVNRQNPKSREFIFEARGGVHIIDLGKTREGLISAGEFLKDLSKKNGALVIVGTKRQAKGIVKEEYDRVLRHFAPSLDPSTKLRAQGRQEKPTDDKVYPDIGRGLFFVTSRWVGGTLTNFSEVSKNFKRLKELRSFLESSKKDEYTKREILLFERERDKRKELYEGIEGLTKVPDALFIIDVHNESTAVREAKAMGVATVGIVDTNADPAFVDYPIPANDDAVGSIKLITSYLVDAWIEGQKKGKGKDVSVSQPVSEEGKGESPKTKTKPTHTAKPQTQNQDKNFGKII